MQGSDGVLILLKIRSFLPTKLHRKSSTLDMTKPTPLNSTSNNLSTLCGVPFLKKYHHFHQMRLALRKLSGLVNHSTEPSSRVDTPPGRRSCFRHRKRPRLRGAGCMKKPGFWGAIMGEVSTSSCWRRPTPFLLRKSSSFLGGMGVGGEPNFPQIFLDQKIS